MFQITDSEKKLLSKFQNKLKKLRLTNNKTQEDIAHSLKMSYRMYQTIEHKPTNINLIYAFRIAKYYNIPIDDLLKP